MGEGRASEPEEVLVMMRQPVIWMAAALMLLSAVMLVVGVGSVGLWIAVITVGIAVVAIEGFRRRQGPRHI
jgi:hypothetical protein